MTLPFSLLSFKDLHKDPEDFSERLGRSFQETGFCGISGHPISPSLIKEVTQLFHEFFSLSTNTKLEYFDSKLANSADIGNPYVLKYPDSAIKDIFENISSKIETYINSNH